jgi:hypothetical protein
MRWQRQLAHSVYQNSGKLQSCPLELSQGSLCPERCHELLDKEAFELHKLIAWMYQKQRLCIHLLHNRVAPCWLGAVWSSVAGLFLHLVALALLHLACIQASPHHKSELPEHQDLDIKNLLFLGD